MTRKQYIRLADAIKNHNAFWNHNAFGVADTFKADSHLITLANVLAEQNPRFDKHRWLDYIAGRCGPNGGKR